MQKGDFNSVDFVLLPDHLLRLYPEMNKTSVSKMLYRIKVKLKKPKSGLLLGSEYCEIKGLRLEQLHSIVFAKRK